MNAGRLLLTLTAVIASGVHFVTPSARAAELVYIDPSGVMRWTADQREVALFGANYCLPSSSDYRAAGYLDVDRKKLIERDMAHFARMGWDGLRLALWGDWENCDREGNLIANDHLDLLDYLIFCAKQRGISMLFTPIHRHSALWPDGKDGDAIQGFSKFYPPSELGRNPAAIAAQQNYLRQILAHVNPYTGVALKDEPAIVFIELINEPHHHADDFPGSVAYINALADTVRRTGCEKILFFNLSQDFRMAPAIAASRVQGFSFGWYPTALGAGRTLRENYLRWADGYTPLLGPVLPRLPRIVYEFDSADMVAGYMYPAMVRSFREVGAQFATMFAYDMLDTAPYNLGWQTHYLNLVYSPRKAVSAIIAAEAMRTLPREGHYGSYPENRRFGPFRVSYEENSSEMVTADKFLYANDTATEPPEPAALRKIVGAGSSPVVSYAGRGSYFLDKIDDGRWRLEVYPDATFVQDPFAQRLNHQTVSSRLVWRSWPMQIHLPDLGPAFSIKPLDAGNTHEAQASNSAFTIRPGVYLLSRDGVAPGPLPKQIGYIGLAEFVCPPAPNLPMQAVSHARAEYVAGRPMEVDIDVITPAAPKSVQLHVRGAGEAKARTFLMSPGRDYGYRVTVPGNEIPAGPVDLSVSVETSAMTTLFPTRPETAWTARIVQPREPLTLLYPQLDNRQLFTLRTNDPQPGGSFEPRPADGSEPACLHVRLRSEKAAAAYALSLPIKSRVADRGASMREAKALRVTARGHATQLRVALLEADGTAWTGTIALKPGWEDIRLPFGALRVESGFKLPQGYPGNWNLPLPPPDSRTGPGASPLLERLEHLQLSVSSSGKENPTNEATADIASVQVLFE